MVLRTRIRGAQTADQHYAKRVGMRGHASTGLFGRGAPGGAASTGQRIGCFQRVRGFATASAVAFLGAHPADLLRALAAILYDPGSATRQRTLVWPPAGRQPAYACGAASIWGRLVYTHASARARAHTHTHTLRDMGRPTRISKIYANWHMQADWYVSGQPAGIYAPDWQHIHTVCADQPPAKGPYRHWQQKQPVQTSHTHARCGAGPDPWHRLQPARMRSAVSAGGAMRCGCHATIVA